MKSKRGNLNTSTFIYCVLCFFLSNLRRREREREKKTTQESEYNSGRSRNLYATKNRVNSLFFAQNNTLELSGPSSLALCLLLYINIYSRNIITSQTHSHTRQTHKHFMIYPKKIEATATKSTVATVSPPVKTVREMCVACWYWGWV